jgi:predicted nucleotidyltransferase
MLTANFINDKLKEIKPYLADRFRVQRIGYFGSYANGDFRQDSDIDILVEFSSTPGWDFFDLEEYLENVFGKKIDLVTKGGLHNGLKDQILKSVQYID